MPLDDQSVEARYRERSREMRNRGEEMHRKADRAFGFYSGTKQWAEEDKMKLRSEHRPALTLNHVKPIVDVVTGSEVTSRFSQKYLPFTPDDQQNAQNFTETVRFIRDKTNAEYEESMAFGDAVKTGLGCCEMWQSTEDDPEGLQRTDRVPLFEIFPDPNARKINLLDSEDVLRDKYLSRRVFRQLWPHAANLAEMNKGAYEGGPEKLAPASGRDAWTDPPDRIGPFHRKNAVRVSEYNWFEREPRWISADPNSGEQIEFKTKDEAKQYQQAWTQYVADQFRADPVAAAGLRVPAVAEIIRKIYYRAMYCGANILEWGEAPLQKSGFPYKFITCFEEICPEETTWFGIVRNAEGPQEAYNKFISQIVHILSVNPKGGIGYETGAIADPQKFRQQWADPAAVLEFNPGGLQKIRDFAGPKYPTGIDTIAQTMKGEMPEVTGVNINYLAGQVEDLRRTATSVVQTIQRQGMIVLSNPFDALRLFRRECGRTYQEMIALYWQDGRLVRLTGNEYAPYVKDWATANYDVVVDEVATSPNQQLETWNAMTQTNKSLEMLVGMGAITPDEVADLIPDLPMEMRQRIKSRWAQQQAAAQAAPPPGVQPGAPPA